MLTLAEELWRAAKPGEVFDAAELQEIVQRRAPVYDKDRDGHYNLISALHKSVRGSDPDAALYWLCRMLDGGCDPGFLARRLLRMASEDIGNADPRALTLTLAAWDSYDRLGTPEGELALAQACVFLALAPKSVAVYRALGEVKRTIADRPADPVPLAIRNAPTALMKGLGYGRDYVYAPDTDSGVAGLDCLPESISGTSFYRPTEKGFELKLGERLREFARRRNEAARQRG